MFGRVMRAFQVDREIWFAIKAESASKRAMLKVILDLGFSDDLALQAETIADLGLHVDPNAPSVRVQIASGEIRELPQYLIRIEICGKWKTARVIPCGDNLPAHIGVTLLDGLLIQINLKSKSGTIRRPLF